MIETALNRGIRVVLDPVAGHTFAPASVVHGVGEHSWPCSLPLVGSDPHAEA